MLHQKSPFLLFSLLLVGQMLWSQTTGTLLGSVKDAKTQEPLIGATVLLESTNIGTTTDLDGRFSLENIPPKTYNVVISFVGYTPVTRYNVVVRSGGNPDLTVELSESINVLGDVVVTPNPFEKLNTTPLSIQKLSQEEIVAYPGGNNDIAKVVQSLPGVSGSVGGFRNDVIIRGGAPNENVYFLDGIEIPNINHFATQGSAGGPVGLLNVSFFDGVTLSASAFGAQYDNVLSGVLQFDQRNGNPRKFQTNFRISSSEAALTTEGPLFKKGKEESKTTFIASVRRSYLQLLFEVIGLPFLPNYWDYQYKINHKINTYNEIYITGVGSIDDLTINDLEDLDAEQKAIQDQLPVIQQRTNTIGVGWRKRFKSNNGFLRMTLSNNILDNGFSQYEDNINLNGLFLENDSREMETRLRTSITQFAGKWTHLYGITLIQANYTNNTTNLVNNRAFNTSLQLLRYGLFAQSSARFVEDKLGISFGLRADGNTFTNTGNEIYKTLSPRASISYRLSEDGDWTINASLGRYFKILPYTSLGFQNNDGIYTNQDAKYILSDHVVLGMEYLLNKSSRLTVEGFYKRYDNYPVSITDNISLANKGGGFEVFGNEPITSDGKGRTYGVELLYQQKFNGKWYAVAALTFYNSEFTNSDNTKFLPAVWDNGTLISLLAGYKFGNNWEASMRYRYLGKAPYPPTNQAATLANYPAVIFDYDNLGTVRLDPFSQMDIRVDKKWNFKKFSFDLFLDIQNALAQAQPSEPRFGLSRDDKGEIITPTSLIQVNESVSGSVLPSLGIVLNF